MFTIFVGDDIYWFKNRSAGTFDLHGMNVVIHGLTSLFEFVFSIQ